MHKYKVFVLTAAKLGGQREANGRREEALMTLLTLPVALAP